MKKNIYNARDMKLAVGWMITSFVIGLVVPLYWFMGPFQKLEEIATAGTASVWNYSSLLKAFKAMFLSLLAQALTIGLAGFLFAGGKRYGTGAFASPVQQNREGWWFPKITISTAVLLLAFVVFGCLVVVPRFAGDPGGELAAQFMRLLRWYRSVAFYMMPGLAVLILVCGLRLWKTFLTSQPGAVPRTSGS